MNINKRKKGFTLIELIAVLVIMAIIALIATPLVMNIIRKARISADKRSIDAYGRSIELAIAGYLMDTGSFPTSIEQLKIEYSGPEVVCETTQINSDSSIYLTDCTVKGRTVDYAYGVDKSPSYTAYSVGDKVRYKGIDYYVIKDSGVKQTTVTLLKAKPLSVNEVNRYGAGHVNRYTYSSAGTTNDNNGYGGMAYYTSETCGYINNALVETGCTVDYAQSEVKYAVDAWKAAKAPDANEARLISTDEYVSLSVEEQRVTDTGDEYTVLKPQYDWMYNNNYNYLTNTPYTDSSVSVRLISSSGDLSYDSIYNYYYVVRPVIVLDKTIIENQLKESNYEEYEVGTAVKYNGVDYYVMKDSGFNEENVTLLKSTPLTVDEVNQYGVGYINKYTDESVGAAYDYNGYGAMAYYTSESCHNGPDYGCTSDYEQSDIKHAVDAWKTENAPAASEARLITINELVSLGFNESCIENGNCGIDVSTPTWLFSTDCFYWTMSPWNNSSSRVWFVSSSGGLGSGSVFSGDSFVVRPVITISKSNLSS